MCELHIRDLALEDAGEYMCVCGQERTSATLSIRGKVGVDLGDVCVCFCMVSPHQYLLFPHVAWFHVDLVATCPLTRILLEYVQCPFSSLPELLVTNPSLCVLFCLNHLLLSPPACQSLFPALSNLQYFPEWIPVVSHVLSTSLTCSLLCPVSIHELWSPMS